MALGRMGFIVPSSLGDRAFFAITSQIRTSFGWHVTIALVDGGGRSFNQVEPLLVAHEKAAEIYRQAALFFRNSFRLRSGGAPLGLGSVEISYIQG